MTTLTRSRPLGMSRSDYDATCEAIALLRQIEATMETLKTLAAKAEQIAGWPLDGFAREFAGQMDNAAHDSDIAYLRGQMEIDAGLWEEEND